MSSAPETTSRLTPEFFATLLITLVYIIWILSLPAWPSQDGPVHLYYTQILSALLSHQPTPYTQFFTVRHLLPPYALYYYALLVLSKFVPLLLADRLIICAYILSFVFGFRYLARALGSGADTAALFATLLIFNWSLGMGFVNFCLSLSFAFWAVGLWLRFGDRHDLWRRAGFVLLAFVVMFTHPIPLALVLALCTIFFLVDLLLRGRPAYSSTRRALRRDLVTLFLASLTLVYVKLFTTSHPLEQVEPEHSSLLAQILHRSLMYAREDGVTLLFGHMVGIRVYRLALALLLVVSIAFAVWQRLRNRAARRWTHADTLLVLGIFLLVVLPFIPSQLNGLFYFAARLPLIVWITLLLAASGFSSHATPSSPRHFHLSRAVFIVLALLCTTALLSAADTVIRPAALAVAAVDCTPVRFHGQIGFILEDPREPASVANGASWNPSYWAAIHLFRHNTAILANAPWMDETILPIGPLPALPEQSIPALRTPQPGLIYSALMASPSDRAAALSASSLFVVLQAGRSPNTLAADSLLAATPAQQGLWTCSSPLSAWYSICQKAAPRTASLITTQSVPPIRIN
jgi:hypothetical protein